MPKRRLPLFEVTGAIAAPRRLVVDAAIERGIDAHIATDLDAGVGARDVEETGTIQGADPHVLDRFGLDGKISCLCPSTHGEETRRGAEDKALNHLHVKPPSCSI